MGQFLKACDKLTKLILGEKDNDGLYPWHKEITLLELKRNSVTKPKRKYTKQLRRRL